MYHKLFDQPRIFLSLLPLLWCSEQFYTSHFLNLEVYLYEKFLEIQSEGLCISNFDTVLWTSNAVLQSLVPFGKELFSLPYLWAIYLVTSFAQFSVGIFIFSYQFVEAWCVCVHEYVCKLAFWDRSLWFLKILLFFSFIDT